MALYEKRLARDLKGLREQGALLGEMVRTAQGNAIDALLNGNLKLANKTVLGDYPINRKVEEITRLSHAFMARHLPTAGHLRQVSSILRVVNELERIGDYAVTIARESIQLRNIPKGLLKRELEMIANQAETCLRQAMNAFNEKNAELAKGTMEIASQVKRESDSAFADFVSEGGKGSAEIQDILYLFVTLNMLKRVGDRAKNICEQTLFTVSGKTKASKTCRILFIDEENTCQSRLAEAIARKTFPNSGHYKSAGRNPGRALHPGLREFMKEHNLEPGRGKPRALEVKSPHLGRYNVVISLQGPVESYVPQQPFRTAYLDWDVGPLPTGLDKVFAAERFAEMYREINVRLSDLMDTLRGQGAN